MRRVHVAVRIGGADRGLAVQLRAVFARPVHAYRESNRRGVAVDTKASLDTSESPRYGTRMLLGPVHVTALAVALVACTSTPPPAPARQQLVATQTYATQVLDKISRTAGWAEVMMALPVGMEVKVSIPIAADGTAGEPTLLTHSSRPNIDEDLLDCIRRASPFPSPPTRSNEPLILSWTRR